LVTASSERGLMATMMSTPFGDEARGTFRILLDLLAWESERR
jgi:hypothetical protein